ncbi:hypothetical protein ACJRO7_015709 [Eucalyptus globulus]|uniref:TIR domain-containing protein n=1 Tax=Eucalyptus globulus TaxID=34317 RepID=A0ABD3L4K8_EUCGL
MTNSEAGMSSDVAPASGCEYQVFLNFRGPDTRHGFTDFLYHGLIDAGVHVFKDEDELRVGEVIGGNLLRAINSSKIYIPIFSATYASSKWCLRELTHIVDNMSKFEGQKSILPIFLDVEPEDVKLKTPRYANAFLEHANKFRHEVEVWRKALAEVDEIKGWNVKMDQSHATIIKSVVKKVLEKLELKQKSVTEHLVGLDDRVKHLIELLDVNHRDVRLIGIYGMGGIGKTTIAKVIFNKLSSLFGKCCSFLEDVRESMLTKDGILQLQKKLLSDIVDYEYAEGVKDGEEGMRRIGETLSTKKVLVVLDDVDNKDHIKKLIGNKSLHSGSRIIITTRNITILQVQGFKDNIIPYEMLKMDDALALQLFCQHAFGKDFPLDDYLGLSNEIVSITGGLPLAIEVIGSLLNWKNKAFWKETLVKLRNVPEEEILKKLQISYDDLDEYQQQIFLDIACFFLNESKTDAIYMWTDCQLYPERGIDVLTNKCLIKIVDTNKFWMHNQLVDMARQIVRQESPSDLSKRSRLWITKEAVEIIRTEERKDKVQALEINEWDGYIQITNEEFERLQNLRLLKLCNGTYVGDFAKCHSKLRWISWQPFGDFQADNLYLDHLVVFKLGMNFFTDDSKAWNLIKRAQNLKVLSLTECEGITTIPDFSKCLGLERLTLIGCNNVKSFESFIAELHLLIELEIVDCVSLTDLPEEVGALVKLKHFSLRGCYGIRELPSSLGNLTSLIELDLSYTRIRELPNFIYKLKSLRTLLSPKYGSSSPKHHVWHLPSGISMLGNLEVLDLSWHNEMRDEIPIEIGELSYLRILNLNHTGISKIPRTISRLHHLQTLNLWGCHSIQVLPELPASLTCLLLESMSLVSVPNLSNLTNLVELHLHGGSWHSKKSNPLTVCNLRWIGKLSRLKKLQLSLLNVPTPPELASLSYLEELVLRQLDPKPILQLPSSAWTWRNLLTLEIGCCEVEDIPLKGFPRLEKFIVETCVWLQRLFIPLELERLREVDVSNCQELVEIQVVGLLKSLEFLYIYECKNLIRISGLSYLKNLETLRIKQCYVLTNVEGLDELESLTSLEVESCMSLRWLIDASCKKIPDDCLVEIKWCGAYLKDSNTSSFGMSMKHYREEILLSTSNKMEHPFIIRFHLGVRKPSEGFEFAGGILREKKDVTPDSVTYKGLIADIKGFGFRTKRMWYETPGEYHELIIEIKSDEQVKGMAQLASKRGLIHLYVEGGVDSEWEGEYDDELMEMLREEWRMKIDVYSDEDGAEWDVSGPDEYSDFASVGNSETDGTSSIDDFQSEPGNAKCFEDTGNRRQMRDRRIWHYGSVARRKTARMENRKKDNDESWEPANQNDVLRSSCQRCQGAEHDEKSCKATTEVEDQRHLSPVSTEDLHYLNCAVLKTYVEFLTWSRSREIELWQLTNYLRKQAEEVGPYVRHPQEGILQKEAEDGI